jgi:hypothetical protein
VRGIDKRKSQSGSKRAIEAIAPYLQNMIDLWAISRLSKDQEHHF